MSGTVGINRLADFDINDCEVLLHYTPSRDRTGDTILTKLDPTQVLVRVENPNNTTNVSEFMGGLYTLKLPTTNFNQKGFYSIIIRPLEIRTKIVDCGVLSSYPDIKGLVFDTAAIDNNVVSKFENNGLIGYRIEYISTDPNTSQRKIPNFFTIITSNNKAEPVNQNLSNTNQKAIRYRFNDNSTLVYATVSPSASSNVKPNVLPFIGQTNQEVIITNTFFDPIMVEIEMVEHDIETIAYGLYGNQSKSIDDGILTAYNFNNDIYKQWNLYEIRDQFTGKPLFEIRETKSNVDFTKQFNDISNV
jgi:hypothetical protein